MMVGSFRSEIWVQRILLRTKFQDIKQYINFAHKHLFAAIRSLTAPALTCVCHFLSLFKIAIFRSLNPQVLGSNPRGRTRCTRSGYQVRGNVVLFWYNEPNRKPSKRPVPHGHLLPVGFGLADRYLVAGLNAVVFALGYLWMLRYIKNRPIMTKRQVHWIPL